MEQPALIANRTWTGPASASAPERQRWRADIDGLRAVAVVPVVIFHVAQSYLRGGYVGVDIFFVISGYLISRNIVGRLREGSFSVLSFYEHRIRRIVPAYAVVLVAVLAFVVMHELPPDARRFGAALLAAVISVTNVYFWQTTDYFAQPAEELPLLHTWSLSVEEQFYLIFPFLMLLAVWAGRAWPRWSVLVAFVLSFAWSAYAAVMAPTPAFYLLPSRAWELLLGAVLALGLVPPLRSRASREAATSIGLLLIATSMISLTPYTPFPGFAAVAPCLGAALILHAGESGGSVVASVLATRSLVFVGLISYSLYLWHWPVLALHRTGTLPIPTESKFIERGTILALSVLLAVVSWWWVERPMRDRTRVSTPLLLWSAGGVMLALALAGLVLILTEGLPNRFKPETVAVARYLAYDQTVQFREGRCFLGLTQPASALDWDECLPNRAGRANHIIMGDSHAAALASGLRQELPDANLLQVTAVACPPLLPRDAPLGQACAGLQELVMDELLRTRHVSTVWLTARWNAGRLDPLAGWSDWLARLERMVAALKSRGVAVIVIGPSPEYRGALPRLLARALERGGSRDVQDALADAPFELDRMMARYAQTNGIRYFSLMNALCHDGRCLEYATPDVPIYFDSNHFTQEGAALAARALLADGTQ